VLSWREPAGPASSRVASQIAAPDSGSSRNTASAMAMTCPVPAEVHMSNQASMNSSAPPAIALRLARRSPRVSSTAVVSAAVASSTSRPVQASAQFCARAVDGSSTSSSMLHGTRKLPVTSATSRAQRRNPAGRRWARAAGRSGEVIMRLTLGMQKKFCKLFSA
jgi:hypothetical protein